MWYEKHSTPSPLGVLPDPAITRTVRGGELATPEGIHFVQLKKDPKEEGLVQGPSPVNKMCALL